MILSRALEAGAGQTSLQRGAFDDAERRFREVLAEHAQSEAASEALYWAGVLRYKAKNDPNALAETAQAFTTRHADSVWAKKASVWRAASSWNSGRLLVPQRLDRIHP